MIYFEVGNRVRKCGRCAYSGQVVAVFKPRAGLTRYVVEATEPSYAGMLHIFNGDQIELMDDES